MKLGYTAVVLSTLFWTPFAQAQTWGEAKQIAAEESPIDIKLTGWGKTSIKRAMTSEGKADNVRIGGFNHAIVAEKDGYRAFVIIHEAVPGSFWNQDTIQNMAQKTFSRFTLEIGDYFDLDYGAADFRLLPLSFTDKDKKMSCTYYRAFWRNYNTQGYLCAPAGQTLSQEAAKTFVSHISYKSALVPENEGKLP